MKIDTRISERLKKITPSSTLAITAKAKKLKAEGKDIVDFSAGEPDFDTPDFVKAAAIKSIKEGFTKYTPATGILELKKKITLPNLELAEAPNHRDLVKLIMECAWFSSVRTNCGLKLISIELDGNLHTIEIDTVALSVKVHYYSTPPVTPTPP